MYFDCFCSEDIIWLWIIEGLVSIAFAKLFCSIYNNFFIVLRLKYMGINKFFTIININKKTYPTQFELCKEYFQRKPCDNLSIM